MPKARAIACECNQSHQELGLRSPASLVALRRSSKIRHLPRVNVAEVMHIPDFLDDGVSRKRVHHLFLHLLEHRVVQAEVVKQMLQATIRILEVA
jgi:hypothetical protein